MAYLKAYYPLEFYTVILGSPKDENYLDYLSELGRRGYSIINPSINKSTTSYEIDGDNILFPLNNIKSINVQVASKIMEERNKGLFADFFDFVSRTYGYKITRDQILNLIDAGAFDEFKESRSTLRNSIDVAMQYADLVYSPDGDNSLSLSMAKPMPIIAPDNPIDNLDREYEAIGTMLSDNPLRYKKDIYEQNHALTIRQVLDLMEDNKTRNKVISTIGIIRKKKTITTKAKEQMAFVGIFDETSQLEVVFFPKTYKEYGQYTKKNMIVLLEGYIDNNRNENNFIINKVTLLEDVDNG